ncbi:hypothetical protein [uncultured Methanospirillum sp.]|uniref:hypothetical protein n=1 Tax=uncultured Methanospirillum sp. TaxID=262503 RepID=UPI0029C7BFFB|nr:hypothetical protein [uncultured Methanospirillum sp.]
MNSKIIWIVFGVLISIACCIVTGTQTFGPEPLDKLPWFANVSDLIVYGTSSLNETKWSDIGMITTNQIYVQDIIKQNSSLNFTVGSYIPIYILGGTINDPVQAAAHGGAGRVVADWEWGIGQNLTLVYFINVDKNGRYHLLYSESVDPNDESSRSNLTELKSQISEILHAISVPERTPKPTQKKTT